MTKNKFILVFTLAKAFRSYVSISIFLATFVLSSSVLAATKVESCWPKQIHRFEIKDFITKAKYQAITGIEARDNYYEPGAIEWDLNADGKTELILSYRHTPGQNKVCYYIFEKDKSNYKLIGKIYHCGLIALESFNGYAQLEGSVSSSEGIYIRALYRICKDGMYKNTRMDVHKATKFTDDGGPIAASKVFDRTHYPNTCD